jgi:16S rRNA A1518/A1519 N6-dimethyltransferase RsmA/KsgA/DIM1 with predicted DNA glycosylase/AP lyase activity
MKLLVRILRFLIPNVLFDIYASMLEPKSSKDRRKVLIKKLKEEKSFLAETNIKKVVRYLLWHKYTSLPFKWANKYDHLEIEVKFDDESGFYFVNYQGKRMYYPKMFTKNQIIWSHRNVLKEQDAQSPHRYLTDNFAFTENSIVIDAGVAEGNFALSLIDSANKIYLIEPNSEWVEALSLTFKPWKHKVVIIEKFLSNKSDVNNVTFHDILLKDSVEYIFIKMDIEGYEKVALGELSSILERFKEVKMTVCTYHNKEDLEEISKFFQINNIPFEISDGHILFYVGNEVPSFRKTLIRARYAKFAKT